MKIVVYGLTITSAWGNGHATTYRSLLKALAALGHTVDFIEKDVEWYRSNRDLPRPAFCTVHLYEDWGREQSRLLALAAGADAIVIGSYFPDAIAATHALLSAGRGPLLFYDIDTPITLAQLRTHGRADYLEAALIPHYAAYLSFTGGPALRELEQTFGSPRALAFYCSVDPSLYFPHEPDPRYRCDLSYLGTYAADRQPKLLRLLDDPAALLPDATFVVAGAQYPAATSFQPNVRRLTHVAPPDHPAFYSSSRFTLNLTRDDMVAAGYSPSVRLFEASRLRSRHPPPTTGPRPGRVPHPRRRDPAPPQTPLKPQLSSPASPTKSAAASAAAPASASWPNTPACIAHTSSKPSSAQGTDAA